MLYRPEQELLWDTWLVSQEGTYYLFYIRISSSRSPSSPKPSLGDGWNGISLARSRDLLHWEEVGPVLEMHPDAAWLATGMVYRRGEDFVMTFGEERPVGYSVICLATSKDLLHWDRLPEEYDLRPDARYYQYEQSESVDPLPRWGDLSVVPPSNDRQGYLGFAVANARDTLPGHCGTIGLFHSQDGLKWSALPPAVAPGLFPSYEVPGYIRFGDRHYVLFSTNSTAGPRFDPYAAGPHSGTYYVISDCMTGPYVRPPHDNMLFGQRNTTRLFGTYVGRPFQVDDQVLLYHQWTAAPPSGWWGPPKALVEGAPYRLEIRYWVGCDNLKQTLLGNGVTDVTLTPLKTAGRIPVIDWSCSDGSVQAVNRGGTNGVVWNVPPGRPSQAFTDLSDGRVVDIDVRIRQGRGLGIWVGYRDRPDALAVLLNAEAGAVEVGPLSYTMHGASLLFQPDERVTWPVVSGAKQRLRVLFRRNFMEIYIDERFVHAYVSQVELDADRLGFCAELATGDFINPQIWAMA